MTTAKDEKDWPVAKSVHWIPKHIGKTSGKPNLTYKDVLFDSGLAASNSQTAMD